LVLNIFSASNYVFYNHDTTFATIGKSAMEMVKGFPYISIMIKLEAIAANTDGQIEPVYYNRVISL